MKKIILVWGMLVTVLGFPLCANEVLEEILGSLYRKDFEHLKRIQTAHQTFNFRETVLDECGVEKSLMEYIEDFLSVEVMLGVIEEEDYSKIYAFFHAWQSAADICCLKKIRQDYPLVYVSTLLYQLMKVGRTNDAARVMTKFPLLTSIFNDGNIDVFDFGVRTYKEVFVSPLTKEDIIQLRGEKSCTFLKNS